jgi:hypothetical protein
MFCKCILHEKCSEKEFRMLDVYWGQLRLTNVEKCRKQEMKAGLGNCSLN